MLLKLYRLTKQFVPCHGRCGSPDESFYISDDVEKVKTLIEKKYGVSIDENGDSKHYYLYSEGYEHYRLQEFEVTNLF